MNLPWLGAGLLLSGILFFAQGRHWHTKAAGPSLRPPLFRGRIVLAPGDRIAMAALPAQIWGAASLLVGLALIIGLVSDPRMAALLAEVLFIPGLVGMGLAIAVLSRLPSS